MGIADHFGWAVAVTVAPDLSVADRRRIQLVDPGLPAAPIHYERHRLDDAQNAALVATVRASALRVCAASLDALAASLDAPIRSLSLRALPASFPDDIAVLRRPPYEARADAVMYRRVLAEVAASRGWLIAFYDAKSVVAEATERLGERAAEVLDGQRALLGPPWTKDHRTALAAAIVAG